MICNACRSDDTTLVGVHRPYVDYSTEVFDCMACGARFAQPEDGVHEELHAASGSSYGRIRTLMEDASTAYANGDSLEMERMLRSDPKYGFVIDTVISLPRGSKVLEVGCAGGYLTAYLILAGYDCLGVDVSPTAIDAAVASFGDHYALSGSDRMASAAPYDAIVHVGTIGCVPRPVELTRELMGMLSPSGVLAFNSPNVEACRRRPGPWGSTTQPPDLVTLFRPGFWKETFHGEYVVEETATPMDPYQRLAEHRRVRRPEQFTEPHGALRSTANRPSRGASSGTRSLARLVANGLAAVGALRELPAEYGLFVRMRKRPDR